MPRECSVCGKGSIPGSIIVRHGLAKKKGGIGLHVTGISKRRFLPNLQRVHIRVDGRTVRRKVCADCIKQGRVQKA